MRKPPTHAVAAALPFLILLAATAGTGSPPSVPSPPSAPPAPTAPSVSPASAAGPAPPLWQVYQEGAVVFVLSDWSKRWPAPELATRPVFPGVKLAALRFLHEQRHILMHGHEPLDTDTTPNLEGESWLMHHGYTQAEGVANLDQVPEAGALVAIGYPRLQGGTGGYARYVAICPPDWKFGVTVDQAPGAPLPRQTRPLHWDARQGMRVR
jgi:hypothetical protein